jgi:hypothetical protein
MGDFDMTTEDFNAGMARLCAATGKMKTDDLMQTYWESLGKMEGATFAATVTRLIESQDKFPTIPQLWANAKANRARAGESPHASFECSECLSRFSVRVEDLRAAYYFECESCRFYYNKRIRYNGAFLLKAIQAAMLAGLDMARVGPPQEELTA